MVIERTNSRSCVLDAASCVTGISANILISRIGHDGALSGFHHQEIMWALWPYYCEMVERKPMKVNHENGLVEPCQFGDVSAEDRFVRTLGDGDGILFGLNQNLKPHAVAWVNQKAYDPATSEAFDLLKRNSLGYFQVVELEGRFIPNRILLITEE